MIKANELKIGNLVKSIKTTEFIYKVVGLNRVCATLDCIKGISDFGELYYQNIEPIHLNEEWIEKFGLKNKILNINGTDFRLYGATGEDGQICYVIGEYGFLPIIFHVHQLQNLYFALTGAELEVKL